MTVLRTARTTALALFVAAAGLAAATPQPARASTSGYEFVGWGDDSRGQLTNGSAIGTRWTAISSGDYHTLALRDDGTAWAWGYNASGELGNGTTTDSSTPVQVAGLTNVALATSTTGDPDPSDNSTTANTTVS